MADMWEVLQQLGKFEWAVKRPYATEGGEALNFPPIFCWRYQNQSEEQLEIIRKAISGMLPDNRLKDNRLARLRVIEGEKHNFIK